MDVNQLINIFIKNGVNETLAKRIAGDGKITGEERKELEEKGGLTKEQVNSIFCEYKIAEKQQYLNEMNKENRQNKFPIDKDKFERIINDFLKLCQAMGDEKNYLDTMGEVKSDEESKNRVIKEFIDYQK